MALRVIGGNSNVYGAASKTSSKELSPFDYTRSNSRRAEEISAEEKRKQDLANMGRGLPEPYYSDVKNSIADLTEKVNKGLATDSQEYYNLMADVNNNAYTYKSAWDSDLAKQKNAHEKGGNFGGIKDLGNGAYAYADISYADNNFNSAYSNNPDYSSLSGADLIKAVSGKTALSYTDNQLPDMTKLQKGAEEAFLANATELQKAKGSGLAGLAEIKTTADMTPEQLNDLATNFVTQNNADFKKIALSKGVPYTDVWAMEQAKTLLGNTRTKYTNSRYQTAAEANFQRAKTIDLDKKNEVNTLGGEQRKLEGEELVGAMSKLLGITDYAPQEGSDKGFMGNLYDAFLAYLGNNESDTEANAEYKKGKADFDKKMKPLKDLLENDHFIAELGDKGKDIKLEDGTVITGGSLIRGKDGSMYIMGMSQPAKQNVKYQSEKVGVNESGENISGEVSDTRNAKDFVLQKVSPNFVSKVFARDKNLDVKEFMDWEYKDDKTEEAAAPKEVEYYYNGLPKI